MAKKEIGYGEVIDSASQVNAMSGRRFAVVDHGSTIKVVDGKAHGEFNKDARGYQDALDFLRQEYQATRNEQMADAQYVFCSHPDCMGMFLPHEH